MSAPGIGLDAVTVASLDPSGQAAEILDLPTHLRDAPWRVESAGIERHEAAGGLVVAGMGGSAIGARLALGVIGDRARRPITLAQGYALPSWVQGPEYTVLCSSYSGHTEETLACYDLAKSAGTRRIVASTGGPLVERAREDGVPVIPVPAGFQPRAAVGYSTGIALGVAALCGAAPDLGDEIEAAAGLTERLAAQWAPAGPDDAEPKQLARALLGRLAVIAGAELTAPIAYRWKCQLNENAKVPAFSSELPELDHNEIEGWGDAERYAQFALVLLSDRDTGVPTQRRLDVTAELVAGEGSPVHRIASQGETRAERLASLVLLGDLVSLYLAVLRGVDPATIDAIGRLKEAL